MCVGKEDVQNCSTYREDLRDTRKLWEKVIEQRPRQEVFVLENQSSFMPRMSIMKAIFSSTTINREI